MLWLHRRPVLSSGAFCAHSPMFQRVGGFGSDRLEQTRTGTKPRPSAGRKCNLSVPPASPGARSCYWAWSGCRGMFFACQRTYSKGSQIRRRPARRDLRLCVGSCPDGRAGDAPWCWMHAMSSHLRAHSASPIYGCPVCRTGRREQWSSCDVKDGQRHPELDLPVDERVIHPPGHTALRRRIAGGVLGSPQAVGGRLGVSRRPVPVRSDSHLPAGVASWSSARPRCANLRPAATQRVPPTSQAHLALNSHVQPPPRVLVSESRLPARRQVLAARGR